MSKIQERLTSRENLTWAWQKARRLYRNADWPVDWAEVANFELDLERQLRTIASGLKNLTYKLSPLVLLPQPKKPDLNGNRSLRQSFHVAVRDQVAWIALVNVIGPTLDSAMPAWSYGHRLYKAAWFEDTPEGVSQLEIGPYRHSSGHLYRRFKHSWPLFRRHISLAARQMVNALGNDDELDAPEKIALNQTERPSYLDRHFWPQTESSTLYYASIDLEQFYPKVKKLALVDGLRKSLPEYLEDAWLQKLIDRMLDFRVGSVGSRLLNDTIVQPLTTIGKLDGIPTGLMVAGFLSNVALLPLDALIEERLQKRRRIAHFRFVDDHAIVAYNFDELRQWIHEYESLLAQLDIGPRISPTKFDPKEMADAYKPDATEAQIGMAKSASEMNGSHPSKLMTKTLALVSELAGADFDILAEDSRGQRLNQLEWLLLADLPDREIRADTRAAFAAGRIASLVPIAFSPSGDLLRAWRNVARLQQKTPKDAPEAQKSELETAQGVVAHYQSDEYTKYRKRIDHYFKLVFQAFSDHPDKPRLFIRVLDYCRAVGHTGTERILQWISEQTTQDDRYLADYLRPLAIQTIAKHIASAAFDIANPKLLDRQRSAARRYLRSIVRPNTFRLLKGILRTGDLDDVASIVSRQCFLAATSYAVSSVSRHASETPLHSGFVQLAHALEAPPLAGPSDAWLRVSGATIGAWTHWLDGLLRQNAIEPGAVWMVTAPWHDPTQRTDWLSLRKGPQYLTEAQAAWLSGGQGKYLVNSDAGWLLDQQASANPIDLSRLNRPVALRLRRHLEAIDRQRGKVTAERWVSALKAAAIEERHDPRASEWTALEILRQLLDRIKVFPGLDLAVLDELHPTNVLLPDSWLSGPPDEQKSYGRWTWESWKNVIRSNIPNVTLLRPDIEDFRRRPSHAVDGSDPQALWTARLRGCGLLLLGLIREDFRLPSNWNVRGLERGTGAFVRTVLEEIPVSSHTHAIIEAALLPRNAETAIIRSSPWAFFGNKPVAAINDTKSDPPLLPDIDSLGEAIVLAQTTLEAGQISVLDHTPRQLIPMNVMQLLRAAVRIEE